MSTNPEIPIRFEELAAGHVLGTLDAQEQQEFEALQKEASEKELAFLVRLKKITPYIDYTVAEVPPSPALKRRIIAQAETDLRIQEPSQISKFSTKSTAEKIAAYLGLANPCVALGVAASLAVLFLVCLAIIFATGTFSQKNRIRQLTDKVEQQQQLLAVLGSRKIDVVVMNGEGNKTMRYGKVVWDPVEMKAILQVRNLPKTPQGKAYQLWLQRGGKTTSAGVFTVDRSNEDAFFRIEKLAERYQAKNATFMVTLENKRGADRPTGQRFLIGKDM